MSVHADPFNATIDLSKIFESLIERLFNGRQQVGNNLLLYAASPDTEKINLNENNIQAQPALRDGILPGPLQSCEPCKIGLYRVMVNMSIFRLAANFKKEE